MLEAIAQALAEWLLTLFWWILLWPVVMLVCAPFVLLRGAFLALTRRQRFGFAVRCGFYAVSDYCGALTL